MVASMLMVSGMKTSHQFAQELLAGPDLPIFIFHRDDHEDQTVLSPAIQHVTLRFCV